MPAVRARLAGRALTVAGDYLLLLAVLLGSADLAYAERQFTLLGPLWSWHLLLLAVVHAAVAYAFASPLVLAASLTALAGWFGVGGTLGDALHFADSTPALGGRALACAAVIAAWRYADRRARPDTRFSDVFDHFAANLAFWGAIAWCLEWPWLAAGLPLLAALAYASVRRGLDTGREAFLVYGIVYAAIGALCRGRAAPPWHHRVARLRADRRVRRGGHAVAAAPTAAGARPMSRWRPSPAEERWLEVASELGAVVAARRPGSSAPAAGAAPARSRASRSSCWGSSRPRCSSGFSASATRPTCSIAGLIAALAAEWLTVRRRLHASGIEEGLCVAGFLLIGAWITTLIGPGTSTSPAARPHTLVLIAAAGAAGLRRLNPLVTTCAVLAFVHWVGSTASGARARPGDRRTA